MRRIPDPHTNVRSNGYYPLTQRVFHALNDRSFAAFMQWMNGLRAVQALVMRDYIRNWR